MLNKLRKLTENRDRVWLAGIVVVAVAVTLWINSASSPKQEQATDWTTSVPQGYLVVPLNLSNGRIIAHAVERTAVVDVFKSGQHVALAENLRLIRLGDDPPSFGAMVPDNVSGQLQPLLAGPGLTAAIRTPSSGATRFHLQHSTKTLLREISTGD